MNIPSPIIQTGTSFDKTVERNRVAEVCRVMNGLSDAQHITISCESAHAPNLVHSTDGPVSASTSLEKNLNADPLNAVEYLGTMNQPMQIDISNQKLKIAGDPKYIDMVEEQLVEAFEGKPGTVKREKSNIKGLNDYLIISDGEAQLSLALNGLDALSTLKGSARIAAATQQASSNSSQGIN